MKATTHFGSAKSLFFLIIGGVFILGLAFVIAGIVLVSLGATGKSHVAFFGIDMTSANVGIVSIAFGAAVIVVIVRNAMKHIQAILALSA